MAKEHPELYKQIEEVRTKLADKIAAGEVLEVPVAQYVAFVDEQDQKVLERTWWVTKSRNSFYAFAKINGKDVSMHRFIYNLSDPKVVIDHKDFCGLNNTRENARVATVGQNNANRRKSLKTKMSSPYKGVSWHKNIKKRPWQAYIRISQNGDTRRRVFLGYFATQEEAALAYNRAASQYFGEYAHLNQVARPDINP